MPRSTTSSAAEIRRVGIDDLDALVDIYLSSARYHAAIDPDRFRVPERGAARERLGRFVSGEGGVDEYVAAVVDGQLVGSATIALEDRPQAGAMAPPVVAAEIGVAVLDAWRGRGIGTRLIRHLESWAADRDAEWIVLDVSAANVDAARLYERLGYRLDRRRLSRRLER